MPFLILRNILLFLKFFYQSKKNTQLKIIFIAFVGSEEKNLGNHNI